MNKIFDSIRQMDEAGQEYWSARELASVIGYADYRNFSKIIDKAKVLCVQNNKSVEDHFVEVNEMVTIGSEAKRKLKSYHLSRYACLLISMSLSSRKENALPALEYFSGKQNLSSSSLQNADTYSNTDIVFFSDSEGKLRVELVFDGDAVWTTQKRIAEIFQVDVRTVSYHINEILNSGELNKYSVIQKSWITADDGKKYEMNVYNLDMIIAVGYRVNSYKATRFRQWATNTLSEFIRNGYVLDDERFKQGGKQIQVKFDQLLERILEIRASERMAYQKITDIYATACDYQKNATTTQEFYAKVQNKLHWAITGKTAAEIVYSSADATKKHIGLTSWAQAPDGKVLKSDVTIAKNYLHIEQMKELNGIVSAYIDLAANRAKRHIPTTMEQWVKFLDGFLELSSYPILIDKGKVSALEARLKAYEEYDKFRVIQDREFLSDFDKEVMRLKGELGLFDK